LKKENEKDERSCLRKEKLSEEEEKSSTINLDRENENKLCKHQKKAPDMMAFPVPITLWLHLFR
jgi:hypothetical protein